MGLLQSLDSFLSGESPQKPSLQAPSSNEVEHINLELYKKGAELSERNKTLALLQKINTVILNSITHHEEVSQQVASLIVAEGGMELVSIMLYDKNKDVLKHIGCARANVNNPDAPPLTDHIFPVEISFNDRTNILIQAMNDRVMKDADGVMNVLTHDSAQQVPTVKSLFLFPLLIRNQLLGAMAIGLREEKYNVSDYEKDLMGRLAGIIGIALDNSLLYAEVQANNERLKELDILKNEFVSVASHELRTPMTAIKSYLWMALDGKGGELSEKLKYYLDRAYMSVDRLIKMVNDMLNISRIESGRLTINIQAVDIQKLVQEVIDDVQPRAAELGVHVTLESPTPPPPVIADSDKIKEVVFNLVGNSMKFTPKDGKVTVAFRLNESFVEVIVKDTGSGLEAEDIPKLFQKFGLLPGSYVTNQAALGTGLGLYICKSIVELHEGQITARSDGRGKGATFTFSLKVFNEQDMQRLSEKFAHDSSNSVDLVHTQV